MTQKSAADGNRFLQLISSLSPVNDYRRIIRNQKSSVVILAPHGGGIEPGTAKVASGIAGKDLSLYIFEGMRRENNRNLHITSTKFDDPQCLALVQRTPVAITVHGCGGREPMVYLGGLNNEYRRLIHRNLCKYGYRIEFDDTRHAGVHPQNICNQCKSQRGVQVEITTGLRKTFFKSLDREGRNHTTESFEIFVHAVRQAISEPSLGS